MFNNNRPIILNCFSRGGSNILWNMFLSHPELCSPIEETLQIFRFDFRSPRYQGLKIALMSRQLHLFDQWKFKSRKAVSSKSKKYVDEVLFNWKLRTLNDSEMKFKYDGIKYDIEEIKKSRLVIKNNNGLIFLNDIFLEMYPEATFIGLVRHPFALYESHKRRGTAVSNSPEIFFNYYTDMIRKMKNDEKRIPNYHIVKFEDLLTNPVGSIELLYQFSNLDFSKIKKIRFKAKPHTKKDGSYGTEYNIGQHYWVDVDNVGSIIDADVNKYQIEKISSKERNILLGLFGQIINSKDYSIHGI